MKRSEMIQIIMMLQVLGSDNYPVQNNPVNALEMSEGLADDIGRIIPFDDKKESDGEDE